MTGDLRANLSTKIDPGIVDKLLTSFANIAASNRTGQATECLREVGIFAENVLIAVEYLRSGSKLKEVKSFGSLAKQIEADTTLPEGLRVLVPRMAQTAYDLRSKRGAVHEKEIDPKRIDAAACTAIASWIVAELIRNYHSDDEATVSEVIAALMDSRTPLIETFGGEAVVTTPVPVILELMLLISQQGSGATRKSLGKASKFSSPRVTEALQKLEKSRCIHKSVDGVLHLTTPGRRSLSDELAKLNLC